MNVSVARVLRHWYDLDSIYLPLLYLPSRHTNSWSLESRLTYVPSDPVNHYYMKLFLQGYLFDRRQSGRHLLEEWGVPPDRGDVTTCVRRFGRSAHRADERTGFEHITGARMATTNGHEVCNFSISYS